MGKIGIFGGSFNPVHNAHIKTAVYVKEKLELDKVIIVPVNIAPHKKCADIVSGQHRLNMCKLAFENYDFISVSDIELKKSGISYTYLTLEEIKAKAPSDELYLIVGADMFVTLQDWKNSDKIFKLASVVTVPRNENGYSELKKHQKLLSRLGARALVLDALPIPCSSTEVRRRISSKQNTDDLIPIKVLKYIEENNLYRGRGTLEI